MEKCSAHDGIVSGVSETKTEVLNIKISVATIFAKIEKLYTTNWVIILLLIIILGEKLLPYLFKIAFAGD